MSSLYQVLHIPVFNMWSIDVILNTKLSAELVVGVFFFYVFTIEFLFNERTCAHRNKHKQEQTRVRTKSSTLLAFARSGTVR